MKIYGLTTNPFEDEKIHHALFVKPGRSVTVIKSKMKEGYRPDNGKHWTRWEDIYRVGFYKTDKGTLCAFHKMGKKFGAPWVALNSLIDHTGVSNPFRYEPIYEHYLNALDDEFNLRKLSDIFPIAGLMDIDNYGTIPTTLISAFREPDIMSFTRKAFGARSYRKDLVRAVVQADRIPLAIASEFRGLVPVDWIVKYLNETKCAEYTSIGNFVSLRKILLKHDRRTYRRLLTVPSTQRDHFQINDLTHVYRGYLKRGYDLETADRRMDSWTDLHDFHIGVRNIEPYTPREIVNEPITLTPLAKKLDEYVHPELTFVVPKDTDTMRQWSAEMGHCIGSYAFEAVDMNSTFGAVMSGERMLANFQVTGGQLKQLLGKKNSYIGNKYRPQVEQVFRELGVDVSDYWGVSINHTSPFGQVPVDPELGYIEPPLGQRIEDVRQDLDGVWGLRPANIAADLDPFNEFEDQLVL